MINSHSFALLEAAPSLESSAAVPKLALTVLAPAVLASTALAPAAPAAPVLAPAPADPSTLSTEELQRRVFELVRDRVLESIGAGGNWTVTFRRSSDTDTLFSDTMADMIGWDVATRMLPPVVPNRARL